MFLLGFEMVLNIEIFKQDTRHEVKSPVIPLAFPLIAGAGSMTTLISLNAEFEKFEIVMGILINLMIVYMGLHFSEKLKKS